MKQETKSLHKILFHDDISIQAYSDFLIGLKVRMDCYNALNDEYIKIIDRFLKYEENTLLKIIFLGIIVNSFIISLCLFSGFVSLSSYETNIYKTIIYLVVILSASIIHNRLFSKFIRGMRYKYIIQTRRMQRVVIDFRQLLFKDQISTLFTKMSITDKKALLSDKAFLKLISMFNVDKSFCNEERA